MVNARVKGREKFWNRPAAAEAIFFLPCPGVPMRGRKKSFSVELTDRQRAQLQRWQRSTTLSAGIARRARLILLLSEGRSLTDAAQTTGLAANNARKWVRRFLGNGVAGLGDQPGRGRRPVFSPLGRAAPGQDGVRATG